MVFLKEDGSLDIERINGLSLKEYMQVIGNLTDKQEKEYRSKLPINESNEPIQIINADWNVEKDWVDADELINNMRNRLAKKQ